MKDKNTKIFLLLCLLVVLSQKVFQLKSAYPNAKWFITLFTYIAYSYFHDIRKHNVKPTINIVSGQKCKWLIPITLVRPQAMRRRLMMGKIVCLHQRLISHLVRIWSIMRLRQILTPSKNNIILPQILLHFLEKVADVKLFHNISK
jgi:hypothetical protein